MKKGALFIFILLFSLSFILAADNVTTNSLDQINKAYNCLTTKVSSQCSSLSVEEKIFTVMATTECKDQLLADSLTGSGDCWPSSGCKIKTTAQAILALDKTTKDTKVAEEWLLSETISPPDIKWYLQIDSREETACNVEYDGADHKTILKADKTFTSNAGLCLRLSNDDYWLEVSPGCYDKEFEVSCDKDFQTNLLFKLDSSSLLHVSEKITSPSANGRATEKIESSCFKEGGKCNYEGSLWAAMVLDYKGYDISAYMPYLTTMAEKNPTLLPESFLYSLTAQDDYRTTLLLRQKAGKYWEETGNKFYDTAVALNAVSDEPPEKTNTKSWLLEIQGTDGCWQGNIRDTAFILASIWPRQMSESSKSCISSGYYCMAEASCKGSVLSSYSCPGVTKCCDTQKEIEPCSTQTGTVCSSDEVCTGTISTASDTQIGEKCCVGGSCEIPSQESECESLDGLCRTSCSSGEAEKPYDCDFSGDTCCMAGESGSSLWIWILIILILLTIVGIIFRDKLRMYWFKFTSRSSGATVSNNRPGPGPGMGRPIQRRILPPSQLGRPPIRRAPPRP
jgi:hypothetical protein